MFSWLAGLTLAQPVHVTGSFCFSKAKSLRSDPGAHGQPAGHRHAEIGTARNLDVGSGAVKIEEASVTHAALVRNVNMVSYIGK